MRGDLPTNTQRPPRTAQRLLIAAFIAHAILVFITLPNDAASHQDESYYLAASRAMHETGDYLVPLFRGQERFRKPIGFYWMLLPTQLIFGFGVWQARLVSGLSSIALLILAWNISSLYLNDNNRRVAMIWIAVSANVFSRYAHYAVPEMTLTLVMTLAHWTFLCYDRAQTRNGAGRRHLYLFYLLMGIGFMIKGPVGLILPSATGIIFYLVQGRLRDATRLISPVGILLMLQIIVPWYAFVYSHLGWQDSIALISDEVVSRIGVNPSSLFYFLAFSIILFLPGTLLLLNCHDRKTDGKQFGYAMVQMAKSYPFIWLMTYLLFYTLFVREKHPWYALQWLVPLILLLTQGIKLQNAEPNRRSIFTMFPIMTGAISLMILSFLWLFGPIIASKSAMLAILTLTLAASVALTIVGRHQVAPIYKVAVLAIVAMSLQTAVFQLIYTTTQLRPAMTFADYLKHQQGPFRVLINERYFVTKLEGHDIPGLHKTIYKPRSDKFRNKWNHKMPRYVIGRERFLNRLPLELVRQYVVVAEGYIRKTKEHRSGLADWLALAKTRNATQLFDRVVLLEQRGGFLPVIDNQSHCTPGNDLKTALSQNLISCGHADSEG